MVRHLVSVCLCASEGQSQANADDLALKLQPATQKIAVVAGTADPDHRHLALARSALERYAGKLDVQYTVGAAARGTEPHTGCRESKRGSPWQFPS